MKFDMEEICIFRVFTFTSMQFEVEIKLIVGVDGLGLS